MAEVKFVNAVKYKGARYPAHTPFRVDDSDVEGLVSKGAIVTVGPDTENNPDSNDESGLSVKDFDRMKIDDLKTYAAQNNIDISGLEKKADILTAIKAAENSQD